MSPHVTTGLFWEVFLSVCITCRLRLEAFAEAGVCLFLERAVVVLVFLLLCEFLKITGERNVLVQRLAHNIH